MYKENLYVYLKTTHLKKSWKNNMNIFITYKSYIFKVRERMKNGIWDKMNENQQHTCQIGKMNLTDFEQPNRNLFID